MLRLDQMRVMQAFDITSQTTLVRIETMWKDGAGVNQTMVNLDDRFGPITVEKLKEAVGILSEAASGSEVPPFAPPPIKGHEPRGEVLKVLEILRRQEA